MEESLSSDVWTLPLSMMGVGLIVGLFFAFRTEKNEDASNNEAELLAQKERHLEALRELEADKEKLTPTDYQAQREVLLQKAERVVRQIKEGGDSTVLPAQSWTDSTRSDIGTVFFLVVGCLMAFGLYRYSKDRGEGETLTGASMDAKVSDYRQSLIQAKETLKTEPKNVKAHHLLTYDALLNRKLQEAMKHIEVLRTQQVDDAELFVHLGILKLAIQSYDKALVDFNSAVESDPNLGKAYLWRALLYSNQKENKKALADAKKALPLVTLIEEKRFLSSLMDEINKPPPIVSGRVDIESPSSGVVFVIARRAKQGGGPPVAVGRYMPSKSLSFELGKGNMVMGGMWPEEIWLEARLDADGNVMTKDDARSSEMIGPITGTQESLVLTIGSSGEDKEKKEETDINDSSVQRIQGTIEASGNAPSGVIFIIARKTKGAKGPPVAVQKLEATSFPVSFSLGKENLMMGGDWPSEVWLEARLDTDGNAMTKTDSDWYAEGSMVQSGSTASLILQSQD